MSRPQPRSFDEPPRGRRRRDQRARRVFAVTWLLASLVGILWAIATPIGTSPDEPAHLVKAGSVVRGQLIGEPSSNGYIVEVPRYIAASHSVVCTAFRENVPADCIDDDTEDPSTLVQSVTTAGPYNPLYYTLVGWPSLLFGDATGIYAMRIVSAMLSALFLAATARFALGLGRDTLTFAAIGVAATPIFLYLSGAVNPNAIEVAATMAAFTAMLTVVRRGADGRLAGPLIVATLAAIIGANTRGLSPVWIALALAAPLLLISWAQFRALIARPAVWITIGAVVLGALAAAMWTLGSSSLTSTLEDEDHIQKYPGVGTPPLTGFIETFSHTFGFGQQMVGVFGWLDTVAPQAVYFVWAALSGVLVLAAVVLVRGRRLGFAATLTTALLIVPPAVQGVFVTEGGYIWQGRYTLPLFVIAVIGIAVVIGESLAARTPAVPTADRVFSGATSRLFATVWLAWAAAQVYCFAVVLKRNAVGMDSTWGAMVRTPEWAPPGGTVAALTSFAVLVFGTAFLAWWTMARSSTRRPDAIAQFDASVLPDVTLDPRSPREASGPALPR